MKQPFSFQVTSRGVTVNINPDTDYVKLKSSLFSHIKEARDFFAGVDIYIDFSDCKFKASEIKSLLELFEEYKNVNNIYIVGGKKKVDEEKIRSKDTILHRGTVRSGQELKYPTNLVIIGDVNPGSKITAGGDIIVLGKLRGVVHAGAGGEEEAQVIALKLQPTQLRIAGMISRPPDKEEVDFKKIQPERAFVHESNIIIEKLLI